MTPSPSQRQPAWQARVLLLCLRFAGRVPLRWMHAIGALLGQLFYYLPMRENRVAKINIGLCFPELTPPEQSRLRRRCLIETAKSLLELPFLWTRTNPLNAIRQIHGQALLNSALSQQRPVIIAAPHLGAWELLNLWLASQAPITILYRAPNVAWLETVLNACRGRVVGLAQAMPLRAEPQAVKTLLKRLQAGGMVGILPDQKPKLGEGEAGHFFGQEALTMTLLSKLALRTNAVVIFAYAERLAAGQGFAIHLRSADPLVQDVDSLNDNLEACARAAPAQYQWTYKRFSMRADGAKVY